MLQLKDRLITKLLACIQVDPKDPTSWTVNLIQVLHVFDQFDIALPPKIFERELNRLLDKFIVGQVPADALLAKVKIAELMYALSYQLYVSKEAIARAKSKLKL